MKTCTIAPLVFAIGCLGTQAGADSLVLEEVTVTAQKREESLQDVPISISAMNADQMAIMGVQRMNDITAYVPNFSMNKTPLGDSINIRGIQSGEQAGFEQSVGTFVDGLYRGRAVQSRFAFLDTAMVEVLRGPQGTLFGKNTIAGALNITSAKPTDEFESELSVGYNIDFEETEYLGYFSGPLTDTLRGRIALLHRQMDKGWVENLAYPGQYLPEIKESAARLSLEWDVSDNTLVFFKYEYGDFDVVGHPWDLRDGGPLNVFLAALGDVEDDNFITAMGNDPSFSDFAFGIDSDPDGVMDFGSNQSLDGNSEEVLLSVEHLLSSGSTLTAIAGHSTYEFQRFLDADWSPISLLRLDDDEDFEQTSLELRLTSGTGGTFEYIGGLYYQEQELTTGVLRYLNASTLAPVLAGGCLSGGGIMVPHPDPVAAAGLSAGAVAATGGSAALANVCGLAANIDSLLGLAPGFPGVLSYNQMNQDTDSWALFAQSTWNIREDLRLTLGVRYTEEKKRASQSVHAADFAERNKAETFNPLAIGLSEALFEFTTHAFTPDDPGMRRNEESLTWSVNLQYDINADAMVYASTSTGFKAGGFNSFFMGQGGGLGADSRNVSFEDEEVITFEIGSKMTLLDGAAEINAAIFHTEFDDLQVAIFSGNTSFIVQNAAKATSEGIEIEGRWRATEKLILSGSFGWVDFEFDEFPNQACTSDQFLAAREEAYQAALAGPGGVPAAAGVALLYLPPSCSSAGINDLKGRTAANTPEFQASLFANYLQPLGNYVLGLTMNLNWRDKAYRQDDLDPISLDGAVLKVNATVMFAPEDGQWDVTLIGNNLTDETSFNWSNDTPLFAGSHDYTMDPSRSFTIRARLRF